MQLQGLPPGVVEMNNTCLQLQQGGDAMQTAEQIRHVVNAAKIPSVNARYDVDDTGGSCPDERNMVQAATCAVSCRRKPCAGCQLTTTCIPICRRRPGLTLGPQRHRRLVAP
jgi:hypothetical protein